jgi:Lysylphosphatidylglycerol synthase TM region
MKKYLEFVLKFILFFASIYFLAKQFNQKEIVSIIILPNDIYIYLMISSLFLLNWYFEILKWKIIISPVKNISILESSKQTFLAFIAAPFLPAKLGEYGIKTIYFETNDKEKVLIAQFLVNFFQLLVTLIFGSIGLGFLGIQDGQLFEKIYIILVVIIFGISILFLFKDFKFFGSSFQIIYHKIILFSKKINQKVFLISVLRYLVFLHQFYFFIVFFGIELSYFQSIVVISSMYILASFIPSFSVLDLAIKGSISVYLFSFFTNDLEKIIWTNGSMWLFNTFLPLLIGWIWFGLNKFKFK